MESQNIQKEAAQYLAEYRKNAASLSTPAVAYFSQQAVALFFSYVQLTGAPLREAIELLCAINAAANPKHVQIGLEALFPHLIEKLNDAFLPSYSNLYDRLFTQAISFFRQLPEGRSFDAALNRFHLPNEAAVLARKRLLAHNKSRLSAAHPLKKILFLSRVTIGADIAVTSVLMAGLKLLFPEAELVLLGSNKLGQLYQGDSRVRIRPIDYGRKGTLLSRLESWNQVVETVISEVAGLGPQEFCVIDPDSRLTQLGLLPVLPSNNEVQSYFFFPSRSYSRPGSEKLGQLAALWLNDRCSATLPLFPYIFLTEDQIAFGRKAYASLTDRNKKPVLCLSFGVGGNQAKRISQQFEIDLVFALSKTSNLIIDCGATPDEFDQVTHILSALKTNGKSIQSLNNQSLEDIGTAKFTPIDVLTWQGDLGSFASLIAASNLYLGYDSAGQHLAAALNVPTLTVFVNSGSNHFPLRWQPHGAGLIQTIYTNPLEKDNLPNNSEVVLTQTLNAYKQLLNV